MLHVINEYCRIWQSHLLVLLLLLGYFACKHVSAKRNFSSSAIAHESGLLMLQQIYTSVPEERLEAVFGSIQTFGYDKFIYHTSFHSVFSILIH